MTQEAIEKSIQLWSKEPGKARVHPKVSARSAGAQAVLEAGPFSRYADLPPTLGGENAAASPTSLLLGALSGCAVLFIRDTLAPLLGVRVDAVTAEARCSADFSGLLALPGAVPDLQDLELSIQIHSPESEDRIQALHEAWLERCPIYLALTKPLAVSTALARAG